jgi:DHA1 family tetracycline resistance protein-like MFS transporter
VILCSVLRLAIRQSWVSRFLEIFKPMSSLVIVIMIVLVDLLGFTIVMPLLGPFAKSYHFNSTQIGLIMAAFPLCQLIAGPILGRLSDRYGRRPVLIFSQFGTALSFVIMAFSQNFWIMLIARMIDGASGGNILVAQAYIADITKPEHRSRSYGMIGAAFGIGFVLGPLLGGLLISLPVTEDWKLRLPFLVAAGFSTIAWILVVWKLPESLPVDGQRRTEARVLSRRGLVDTFKLPGVGGLVLLGSLNVLAFAALEGTFSLYLREQLNWSARGAMFGFTFLGFVSAFVQGGLIRRLVPKFGEARLILVGLALSILGFAGLGSTGHTWSLLLSLVAVGFGQGLASPAIMGLLSRQTPSSEQGAVFGTYTSAQTLARLLNYMVANELLGVIGPGAPFWEAAVISCAALALATTLMGRFKFTPQNLDASIVTMAEEAVQAG